MRRWLRQAALGAALALAGAGAWGCIHVKSDPIHITVDVNVHVQKDLDNFFGDIDKK